jgi:dienelactone hydrolase
MLLTTCLTALAATPLALGEVQSQIGVTAPDSTSSIAPVGLAAEIGAEFADLLATSPSSPQPAPLKESKPEKKKKYEPVEFKTEDKLTIKANLYAPRKSGRVPAVLMVHDAGSNALSLDSVAQNLQRKGFAVLAVNLRGHGGSISEAYDWEKSTDPNVQAATWAFAMRDLEAATEYLRDLKNVHNSNLSVIGMGAGAVLAAKYAVNDENTRAVVLIEPKPEIYGYNMMRDVTDLGGLPAMIMTTDDGRSAATRIKNAAAKAHDLDYVTLQPIKPKKSGDVFSDKRLNTELTKFLKEEALDKR